VQFLGRQWLQLVPNRDALVQLPQFRRPQQRRQVQLADEDDLDQLLLVGLEIRQDADLFEDLQRQVLRLVDDHHRAGAERDQREEKVVQRVDEILLGRRARQALVAAREHAEILQDRLEQ